MATLPPRPVELQDLRAMAKFDGTVWDWQQALKSLEPTWVRLVRSSRESSAVFSNPSCRDYLLGVLDESDQAVDRAQRIERMDQLLNLAHEASLITVGRVGRTSTERTHLARALASRSSYFASRIEHWTTDATRSPSTTASALKALWGAASLLSVFGNPKSNGWLLDTVRELIDA